MACFPRPRTTALASAVAACALAAVLPAPAMAQQSTDAAKIKELQRRLDQRDAVIRDLLRRVTALEQDERQRTAAAVALGRFAS